MSLLTYPKFQAPDINGVNLAGGLVYFYEAGNSTPKDTYSDSAFTTANTNPVVLNSRGEADIYINGTYKIILKDADDVTIWTEDNYSSETNNQWENAVPSTFSTTTAFKVTGDLTSDYEDGRRIKLNDASTLYGTITSSSYSDPDTTVNISLDSGALSASLTDSQLSILTASNDSLPRDVTLDTATIDAATITQLKLVKGADIASASALTLGTDGNYFDVTGTTAITSISTVGIGTVIKLHFDAALTLTHHATDLILPGGSNITTAAGDELEFIEYATGDWRCVNYQPYVSQLGGDYIHLSHRVASTVQSGTFTSGAWQTRPLNTEETDTGGNCTLSSNQFTLDAGTYQIYARAQAYQVNQHATRLYNITDASVELYGTSEVAGTVTVQNNSVIIGQFTIAAQKTFEFQHYCAATRATNGFGSGGPNASGTDEVYAVVELRKVK